MSKQSCVHILIPVLFGSTACSNGSGPAFAPPTQSRLRVTQQDLCLEPSRYDGQVVDIQGPFATLDVGTAVGCACCNALRRDVVIRCDTDERIDLERAIVLVAASDVPWEAAIGVVESSTATNSNIEVLIRGLKTGLGCVGQQCYLVCAPSDPASLVAVRGVFRAVAASTSSGGTIGHTYRQHVAVEHVDVQ